MALIQLQSARRKSAAVKAPVAVPPSRRVKPETLGVIVGNRGFFPGHLARSGRDEMLNALKSEGIRMVILGAKESNHGAVESRDYNREDLPRVTTTAPQNVCRIE